jgi:hypothetical protein
LTTFTPSCDPGSGGILVTVSGQAHAQSGFLFPPADPTNDKYMVDGWTVAITEYIAVIDKVTLWANPDMSPADQSAHGGQVAQLTGPWVIDLHKAGSVQGQGGGAERAVPIGAFAHKTDGTAFDPTVRYAFGFSTVPATYAAMNVNLDGSEADDYAYMVANKYTVLYVGTATWAGKNSNCQETNVALGLDAGRPAGSPPTYIDGGGFDFTTLSTQYTIRLGFATPTNYVNCQNGSQFPGMTGVNGETHPRGVQVTAGHSVTAQVTLHLDHPFWESFVEESRMHFDQIAAQEPNCDPTMPCPVATLDFVALPFFPFESGSGHQPLPWRDCVGTSYAPPTNGQLAFSPGGVPFNPAGTASTALRDYFDYLNYTQSTQGHLNSQGLCFVDRQYPSPPGGSGK